MFEDEWNRTVLFHGVNVVYKIAPYVPTIFGDFHHEFSLVEEDIKNLKKWGMNFVRLGVMWEAVEKKPGEYDLSYFDSVEVLINRLGEAGIYTLLDAH